MTRKTNIIETIEISRGRSRLKRSRRLSNAKINFHIRPAIDTPPPFDLWIECYLFIYLFFAAFYLVFFNAIYRLRYFHGRIQISKLKNDRNLSRTRQLSCRTE